MENSRNLSLGLVNTSQGGGYRRHGLRLGSGERACKASSAPNVWTPTKIGNATGAG
jgi:hypothetical protein